MEGNEPQDHLSAFEKLPGELRNRIYRYAVVESEVTIILASYSEEDKTSTFRQPELAMVNKHIRNEVLSIYYAENTFVMPLVSGREGFHNGGVEAFDRRTVAWAQSCGPFVSLVTRAGAHNANRLPTISNPLLNNRKSVSCTVTLESNTPPNWRLYTGCDNGCTYSVQPQGCLDRESMPAENLVVDAITICRKELWGDIFRYGDWCRKCKLPSNVQLAVALGVYRR